MAEKELRVKGIFFTDLVKMARKFKELPWEKYLTPEDLQVIRGNILPSEWYPGDLYQRLGVAAFDLVGQSKPENAQILGRAFLDRMIEEGGLQRFLLLGDPERALLNLTTIRARQITLGEASQVKVADRRIRYSMQWNRGQVGMLPFVHNIAGVLGRLVERNGGKNAKITFDDQNLGQRDSIDYEISWE
jgi:hypothetical protein